MKSAVLCLVPNPKTLILGVPEPEDGGKHSTFRVSMNSSTRPERLPGREGFSSLANLPGTTSQRPRRLSDENGGRRRGPLAQAAGSGVTGGHIRSPHKEILRRKVREMSYFCRFSCVRVMRDHGRLKAPNLSDSHDSRTLEAQGISRKIKPRARSPSVVSDRLALVIGPSDASRS